MNLMLPGQKPDETLQQLTGESWTDTPHEKQVSDYLRVWGSLQQILVLYAATPPHHAMSWVKGRERFLQAIQQAQEQFPLLPTQQVDTIADLTESIAHASQLLSAIIESFEERNLDAFFAWIEGTEVFLEALRKAQEILSLQSSCQRRNNVVTQEVYKEASTVHDATIEPTRQAKRKWSLQALTWYQYTALVLLNSALVVFTLDQFWTREFAGILLIISSFVLFEQPWSTISIERKRAGTPGWLHLFLQVSLCILLPLIMALVLHTLLPLISVIAIGWLAWRAIQAKHQG